MFELTIGAARVPKLRDLFPGALRAMEARTQNNIRPRVEADVTDLLAPYPGPVVYPFQFATIKSRKFYFANFKPPYIRTLTLQQAWFVQISATFSNGPLALLGALFQQQTQMGQIQIVIGNSADAARYVYPPKQVPGHERTGWNLDNGAEIIIRTRDYVYQEWPFALTEAIAAN